MPPRRLVRSISMALLLVAATDAAPAQTSIDALRERFPAGSIDSVDKADAALNSTSGAKARVEKDYKDAAHACLGHVLVNVCMDEAREQRRKRTADIDAVELEANRLKRRDRADRLEADRVKRDAERVTNAPADAAQRARNRKIFEDKQVEAKRSTTDRAHSDAIRASSSASRSKGPTVKLGPLAGSEPTAAQRAKNATDFEKRRVTAAAHAKDIDRRVAEKTVERARRETAKAAKEAKETKAAQAATEAVPPGSPSTAGTRP